MEQLRESLVRMGDEVKSLTEEVAVRSAEVENLSGEKVGALLVVPRLDGALERLLRLLDHALEHGVDVGVRDLAALVHLDVLHFAVHLAQDGHARFVVRLQRGLHFVLQLLVFHDSLFSAAQSIQPFHRTQFGWPMRPSAKRRQMPSMP